MDAEPLLAVTGLAALLAGKPRRVTVADGEQAARIPLRIRRGVRRFLKGEPVGDVERPDFDYHALLAWLTADVPQHVIESLMSALPAEADLQSAYVVAVNRCLAYLRGALPVRATMTTTGPIQRRPPGLELAKFRRAWEIAETPMVVLSDLSDGRLVPDQVRALAAMYPGLYDAVRMEAMDAIADYKGDSPNWRLPARRDRQLQTLLQAHAVTPALAADIKRALADQGPAPRKPPTSSGASKVADSFAAPSATPAV